MPFTIEKENEETKIYVNGKEYNEGERIYKDGRCRGEYCSSELQRLDKKIKYKKGEIKK